MKLGEGIEFEQLLAFRRRVEGGVLQNPGVLVEEEDGIEAAARAGLMSLLGLLPSIQKVCGAQLLCGVSS